MTSFQLRDAFVPPDGYRLLPFRFLPFDGLRTLLVNEAGEPLFVRNDDFAAFVERTLDSRSDAYLDLKAKHFLFDSGSLAPFELLVAKYRTKKSFLDGFARLHIFVVTLRCEHSCHYCQVSRVSSDRPRYDMSAETVSRSLDLVFRSTSLDGPPDLHNANRPRPGGDSHARTIDGIGRVRERLGRDRVAALMTTTRRTLSRGRDVVDEYLAHGFNSIFLRPLSPFGFAAKTAQSTAYSVGEFLDFYFDTLDYIVKVNAGGTYFAETYAQLLLRRIFTPFPTGYVDLQSPAGAGIGAVVFNYDGDVYASDESRMLAEMNDRSFRLGNVHRDRYDGIFAGPVVRQLVHSSIVESIPGCCDCAFQSFCGSDPVFNYATQGDLMGHQPSSAFHEKNFAMIRHLLMQYEDDPISRSVFRSWIAEA
jgi:sulfatase maturation enzyme AslB (radical SAM superfamily)